MRRVLHLRASGQLLGAERVVLELSKYLPSFGYEPILGIPVESGQGVPEFAEVARKSGYQVFEIPINGAFDFKALKLIREFVRDNHIDIIHSHGYREDFYALCARSGAKLVATNHLWKRTSFRLRLYAALDAFLMRRFQAIIAVSEPVEQDMLGVGIARKLITRIANGIDAQRFAQDVDIDQVKGSLGLPEDKVIIGTLSSLSAEKGLDYLIRALAKPELCDENFHLLVVGEGEEREALESLVLESGLQQKVTFAGRRSDVAQVLSALDIFALPSLAEGLPMALLEAMAVGNVAVASDVGDVSRVITPDCGMMVEAANVTQLAGALVELLHHAERRNEMSLQAAKRIRQHFSSEVMAQKNATIYDALF